MWDRTATTGSGFGCMNTYSVLSCPVTSGLSGEREESREPPKVCKHAAQDRPKDISVLTTSEHALFTAALLCGTDTLLVQGQLLSLTRGPVPVPKNGWYVTTDTVYVWPRLHSCH